MKKIIFFILVLSLSGCASLQRTDWDAVGSSLYRVSNELERQRAEEYAIERQKFEDRLRIQEAMTGSYPQRVRIVE